MKMSNTFKHKHFCKRMFSDIFAFWSTKFCWHESWTMRCGVLVLIWGNLFFAIFKGQLHRGINECIDSAIWLFTVFGSFFACDGAGLWWDLCGLQFLALSTWAAWIRKFLWWHSCEGQESPREVFAGRQGWWVKDECHGGCCSLFFHLGVHDRHNSYGRRGRG